MSSDSFMLRKSLEFQTWPRTCKLTRGTRSPPIPCLGIILSNCKCELSINSDTLSQTQNRQFHSNGIVLCKLVKHRHLWYGPMITSDLVRSGQDQIWTNHGCLCLGQMKPGLDVCGSWNHSWSGVDQKSTSVDVEIKARADWPNFNYFSMSITSSAQWWGYWLQ